MRSNLTKMWSSFIETTSYKGRGHIFRPNHTKTESHSLGQSQTKRERSIIGSTIYKWWKHYIWTYMVQLFVFLRIESQTVWYTIDVSTGQWPFNGCKPGIHFPLKLSKV